VSDEVLSFAFDLPEIPSGRFRDTFSFPVLEKLRIGGSNMFTSQIPPEDLEVNMLEPLLRRLTSSSCSELLTVAQQVDILAILRLSLGQPSLPHLLGS